MLRIIGGLLLAALLGGCSAIKLGYDSAPQLAYWWLDGYMDFADWQTPKVREELTRLHQWHRSTELPRVAEMVARIDKLAPGEVSAEQACAFLPEIRERMDAVAVQAEPALVALAQTLSRSQIEHMERKYKSIRTDFSREWVEVSPEKVRERRYDQWLDRMEMVYGRLEDPARQALRDQMARSIYDPRRNLAEMLRRHQDFARTLTRVTDRSTSPVQARDLLRGMLERMQRPPDPAQRDYQEAIFQEGCRAIAAVHNAASPAQREAASRRLRAYERDFRDLAVRK